MCHLQFILILKRPLVTAFFDPKMFVVSYSEIYLFHPSLNLDKIVIFRSFQQTAEEIYDLSHFRQEHIPFFNKTTFYQLKDASFAVLVREKSTSLAELFSVELKFTVNTLNDWFSRIIKPKFFELDDIKKQIYLKENPIDQSKTICSVCGFLLNVDGEGWFDFVLKCEHLFLRNIYTFDDLKKKMEIETEEKYSDTIYRLLQDYPLFEKALSDGDICDEVRNFLAEDLDACYSTLKELKDNILHVSVPKKSIFFQKNIF